MHVFGYHAVYERDIRSAVLAAAEHGFHYVQLDLNVPELFIDELSRKELAELRTLAADADVRISLHAPGDNVGLFTDFPRIRRGLIDHVRRVLERANRLGARHLTVHPLSPPSFRRADTLADGFQADHEAYYREVLKSNLLQLSEAAGNVLLLVENHVLGSAAIAALSEIFAEDREIYLALDWQKMHRNAREPESEQKAFYARYRHRIRELHLHDVDETGRSHLAPGQGTLDFGPLFREFYAEGQWLTVEVRPVAEAARAKARFAGILDDITGT